MDGALFVDAVFPVTEGAKETGKGVAENLYKIFAKILTEVKKKKKISMLFPSFMVYYYGMITF